MVSDTSLMAYIDLIPELPTRQLVVYLGIKKYPFFTSKELQFALNFSDANMVRPRINELFNEGLIIKGDKRVCEVTNKLAYTWGVA